MIGYLTKHTNISIACIAGSSFHATLYTILQRNEPYYTLYLKSILYLYIYNDLIFLKFTFSCSDSVHFVEPFQHTGVDYPGHFNVKFNEFTSKMYILIFTCLNVRTIHLELVSSLSTAYFLLAFVKFCNFHCILGTLYSNNASTFLNASKILNLASVDDNLSEHLIENSIKHVRIPVYSAWVGSAWERFIREV